MKNIQHKIDIALNHYDPKEFFPVFYDGRLGNRSEFVAYKLRRLVLHRSLV